MNFDKESIILWWSFVVKYLYVALSVVLEFYIKTAEREREREREREIEREIEIERER